MKRVIITGASSGLGSCFGKSFLDQGYEVISLSRSKPDYGVNHIQLDLTKKESIENAIRELNKLGNIDVFVCCTGVGEIESLDQLTYENAESTFQINVSGQNYLLSGMSHTLIDSNSDIIIVGATIGYKANSFMPVYSMTKWALRGMIENWKEFFKGKPVRVIGVHPGGLETQSNVGEGGREHVISKITGKDIPKLMDPQAITDYIYTTLQLPKNIEVSEMIINRK